VLFYAAAAGPESRRPGASTTTQFRLYPCPSPVPNMPRWTTTSWKLAEELLHQPFVFMQRDTYEGYEAVMVRSAEEKKKAAVDKLKQRAEERNKKAAADKLKQRAEERNKKAEERKRAAAQKKKKVEEERRKAAAEKAAAVVEKKKKAAAEKKKKKRRRRLPRRSRIRSRRQRGRSR
jgi:hypothetical protein